MNSQSKQMPDLILFNKPFNVLCQFTDTEKRPTLKDYLSHKELEKFYPAGRLDKDSEGLLLLTNNGKIQNRISDPKHKWEKTYWVQVEGEIDKHALTALAQGVKLKDGLTRPAKAKRILQPEIWTRSPPIRERKNIPTSWLELAIKEGKNRQVRRMTAAVGFPTLRLIRYKIGRFTLEGISSGEYQMEKFS